MSERERAERIVNRILSIYPLGIVSNGEPNERLICAIADSLEQTAREERARGIEEVKQVIHTQEFLHPSEITNRNAFVLHQLSVWCWHRAKHLREEGGRDDA